jgi:hypothetical protein
MVAPVKAVGNAGKDVEEEMGEEEGGLCTPRHRLYNPVNQRVFFL